MIHIQVRKKKDEILSLQVSGHAGYAEKGEDIVCAGVSAILFGGLNALDELCAKECDIRVEENRVTVNVRGTKGNEICQVLLIQLETVSEKYEKFVKITCQEVQ